MYSSLDIVLAVVSMFVYVLGPIKADLKSIIPRVLMILADYCGLLRIV